MGSDGRVKATLQVNGGVSFDVGGDFESVEVVGGIRSHADTENTASVTERGKHGNGVRGRRIEPHTHMVNLELRQCGNHL